MRTVTKVPWHLDRIDQTSAEPDGRFEPDGIGIGVVIYVLDTGIRMTHEEFQDRAAPFSGGNDGDYVGDEWGKTHGASDCLGHGTHVAALAAGKTFGVASGADIRSVRVGDCDGKGNPSDAVNAIDGIIKAASGPSILLMSLDYGDVQSVRDAVEKAIEKGIVVVAASGASHLDACSTSPGGAKGIITAAGSDRLDTKISFCNFGPCIDLFAPGDKILSASIENDSATCVRSGSSMSAALVAGAAALILEAFPNASPYDVKQALIKRALKNALRLSPSPEDLSTPNRLLQVGKVGLFGGEES